MSVSTRTGDHGLTSLPLSSRRLPKFHPIFALLGHLDELNSLLGIIASLPPQPATAKIIHRLQTHLFRISSEIASLLSPHPKFHFTAKPTRELENWIDQFETTLPPLKHFLFPGGTLPAAFLFLARAVARRAERSLVKLSRTHPTHSNLLKYLNRLSDLLFLLSRFENHQSGVKDSPWQI